jgi:hypothetical protein
LIARLSERSEETQFLRRCKVKKEYISADSSPRRAALSDSQRRENVRCKRENVKETTSIKTVGCPDPSGQYQGLDWPCNTPPGNRLADQQQQQCAHT